MNRLSLHSSSHEYPPTASEALSHGLNFKLFLGEHAPRPPYNTVHALYVLQATNARRPENEASARTDNCVLRAPHQSPLYMYAPPPPPDPPLLVFSVLVCLGCSDGYQEVIQTAARNTGIDHGCPSWFVPINNSSDHCKCGEPIHYPGRVLLRNLNTNQTMVQIGYCMDYDKDKDVVVVGGCPYQKGSVYAKPPQDAVELNKYLCGRLNRTGVMCSQCQEGLGTAIFSYSMHCLHCMAYR